MKAPAMRKSFMRQSQCSECQKMFGLICRRHHCRMCTKSFCDSCCSLRRILPGDPTMTPHRICFACANIESSYDGCSNPAHNPKALAEADVTSQTNESTHGSTSRECHIPAPSSATLTCWLDRMFDLAR